MADIIIRQEQKPERFSRMLVAFCLALKKQTSLKKIPFSQKQILPSIIFFFLITCIGLLPLVISWSVSNTYKHILRKQYKCDDKAVYGNLLLYNPCISFGSQKTGWAFGWPLIDKKTKGQQNGMICSRSPAQQSPLLKVVSSLLTTSIFPI